MLNRHIATSITLDHKFATNMTRIMKNLRNFVNFATIVQKKGLPFLDVSNGKQTFMEKHTSDPENNRTTTTQISISKTVSGFFQENQGSPNKGAPNTYVSPHKSNYQNQSQSPYTKHSSRRNPSPHDKNDCQNTNRMHKTITRSPIPTARNILPVFIETVRD